MIRLANASSTKVFKSVKLFMPAEHTGGSFTSFVINHDLGVIPDNVGVVFDDGRLLYSIYVSGSNTFGFFVDNTNASSVTIRIYRYAIGDFYVVISALSDGVFDFS